MYKAYGKRVFDLLTSLLTIPLVVIILCIIAPQVYLCDKGPVLYRAKRVGQNGRLFTMYKIRTMRVNAPDVRNADGSSFNSEWDPRVTKIGRILRMLSIDELPQFINVLLGDMSIIGPRPILELNDKLATDLSIIKRLSVRPGITGYSQAYYRNSATQEEKFIHDCFYIDNLSFCLDVKIFLTTMYSVFCRKCINAKG